MLSLSTTALPIIKRITSAAADPDQAGLRITEGADVDTLSMHVSDAPTTGDVVLLFGGARVFVAASVSPRLDGLEMYAVERNGDVHLALRERQ